VLYVAKDSLVSAENKRKLCHPWQGDGRTSAQFLEGEPGLRKFNGVYPKHSQYVKNYLDEQIKEQMSHNQQAESRTQTLAKEIDGFVTGTNEMREE